MKHSIAYKFLLVVFCFMLLFPHAVYADNNEKTSPEDWLTDGERVYVAQMRSTFAECRNLMSEMNSYLALPNPFDGSYGVEISAFAVSLTTAYEPFCALTCPESMEDFIPERDRFCALAFTCVAEAQNTGNQWATIATSFNGGFPLSYVRLLNNVHNAITKLESAMGSAENKLDKIIKDIAEGRERAAEFLDELIGDFKCFIATAVYGTGDIETLSILREFRDEYLMESLPGEAFVSLYYKVSPPFARLIERNDRLRLLVKRRYLDPLIGLVQLSKPLWDR